MKRFFPLFASKKFLALFSVLILLGILVVPANAVSTFVQNLLALNVNLHVEGDSGVERNLYVGEKIGIGTTTPAAALDIKGMIKTSSGITFADGTIQTTAGGTSSGSSGGGTRFACTDAVGNNCLGPVYKVSGTAPDRIFYYTSNGTSVPMYESSALFSHAPEMKYAMEDAEAATNIGTTGATNAKSTTPGNRVTADTSSRGKWISLNGSTGSFNILNSHTDPYATSDWAISYTLKTTDKTASQYVMSRFSAQSCYIRGFLTYPAKAYFYDSRNTNNGVFDLVDFSSYISNNTATRIILVRHAATSLLDVWVNGTKVITGVNARLTLRTDPTYDILTVGGHNANSGCDGASVANGQSIDDVAIAWSAESDDVYRSDSVACPYWDMSCKSSGIMGYLLTL